MFNIEDFLNHILNHEFEFVLLPFQVSPDTFSF